MQRLEIFVVTNRLIRHSVTIVIVSLLSVLDERYVQLSVVMTIIVERPRRAEVGRQSNHFTRRYEERGLVCGGVAEWPRPPGGRALGSRIRARARPMAAGARVNDPSRARSALSVQQALKRPFDKIEGMLRRLDTCNSPLQCDHQLVSVVQCIRVNLHSD